MFDSLSDRLNEVFDRLKKRGALSESDVTAALREIRIALLEAEIVRVEKHRLSAAAHRDAAEALFGRKD